MRVSERKPRRQVVMILRFVAAVASLCAVAMPSMASGLVQTPLHFWVSATALSLTLATAAIRPKD